MSWSEAREADIMPAREAIGHYFIEFSQLVLRMRYVMAFRLTREHDEHELGELAFAGAAAQQIADSFFSMCRYDGNFDDDELAVSGALYDEVRAVITERNEFAHGDWWVGRLSFEDFKSVAPPELVVRKPKRKKGDFADFNRWTVERLKERSQRLEELVQDVTVFGYVALGLPIATRTNEHGMLIHESRGHRVGDFLTVAPAKPKEGTKARAVMKTDAPQLLLQIS